MHIYVHRCSCWMYANNIVAFAHLAHKSCCSTRGQLATARRWTGWWGRAVRKSGRVHAWWHMSRQPSKQPTHFAKCHHFCFRSSTSVSTHPPPTCRQKPSVLDGLLESLLAPPPGCINIANAWRADRSDDGRERGWDRLCIPRSSAPVALWVNIFSSWKWTSLQNGLVKILELLKYLNGGILKHILLNFLKGNCYFVSLLLSSQSAYVF